MTPADLDLARRLAAVPGIWRAGMVTTCRLRVIEASGGGLLGWTPGATRDGGGWLDTDTTDGMGLTPDLDNAATRGALLEVAREMWGRPDLHACPMFSLHTGALTGWRVAIDEHTAHYALTEGAAIALTILAAPR